MFKGRYLKKKTNVNQYFGQDLSKTRVKIILQLQWIHLKIALNSVNEGLICHNLCVSFEKRLKAVLSGLQLLLGDLQGEMKGKIVKIQIICENAEIFHKTMHLFVVIIDNTTL